VPDKKNFYNAMIKVSGVYYCHENTSLAVICEKSALHHLVIPYQISNCCQDTVAIGNPEWQVCKASHCGSKKQ